MSVRWAIFYDGNLVFRDVDGPPEKSPADGIQCIVQIHEDGRREILKDSDYYWWTGDSWAYGGIEGLEKMLRCIMPGLKFGRFASWETYRKALEESGKWRS